MYAGHVTFFCGPMFSEKSHRLISKARSALRGGRSVLAVKPRIDSRDKERIVTRSHNPLNGEWTELDYNDAHFVSESDPDELDQLFSDHNPDVFVADEVQFFGAWFVDFVERLQTEELSLVYLAGLDKDAWRQPFGPVGDLLVTADEVKKLKADCFVDGCMRPAGFTQLSDPSHADSDTHIVVGGKGTYEARCNHCWVHPNKL